MKRYLQFFLIILTMLFLSYQYGFAQTNQVFAKRKPVSASIKKTVKKNKNINGHFANRSDHKKSTTFKDNSNKIHKHNNSHSYNYSGNNEYYRSDSHYFSHYNDFLRYGFQYDTTPYTDYYSPYPYYYSNDYYYEPSNFGQYTTLGTTLGIASNAELNQPFNTGNAEVVQPYLSYTYPGNRYPAESQPYNKQAPLLEDAPLGQDPGLDGLGQDHADDKPVIVYSPNLSIMYYWTDENGVKHYTNNIKTIPIEYIDEIQTLEW